MEEDRARAENESGGNPPPTPKKGTFERKGEEILSQTLSFRCTPAEKENWQALAKAANMDLRTYFLSLRQAQGPVAEPVEVPPTGKIRVKFW